MDPELANEKVATSVLQDLRSIRLDSVGVYVSQDVLTLRSYCTSADLTLVGSMARVLPSLRVPPSDVRRQVLKQVLSHI